jgi:hypothetical protein
VITSDQGAHRFFQLRCAFSYWGDFGAMLAEGMCDFTDDDEVLLRKTGPFVPPISEPLSAISTLVVTDEMKQALIGSGLAGLTFHEVIKAHVVKLHWEKWDRSCAFAEVHPESGDPVDYIEGQAHSAEAALEMGAIWEARAERLVELESIPRQPHMPNYSPGSFDKRISAGIDLVDGLDFFRQRISPYRPSNATIVMVSLKAKRWLTDTVPDWVTFRPLLP